MDEVIIRRATKEEMPLIVKMNIDVFYGEQGIPCDLLESFASMNPVSFCAELNGKIVATVSYWKEEGQTHCGRLVVLPECRGLGVGKKIVEYMFTHAFNNGVEKLVMEVRDITRRIVLNLGGKVTGESYFFYGDNATPMEIKKEDFIPFKK